MRLLFIVFSLTFLTVFFIRCSEETTLIGTIVSEDTIQTGHDARLVGSWAPVKYIREDGSEVIMGTSSLLQMSSGGGYSDDYPETQGRGTWETRGDSLKFQSTQIVLNVSKKREGTYSVSANEFIFITGGKTWYYQKK